MTELTISIDKHNKKARFFFSGKIAIREEVALVVTGLLETDVPNLVIKDHIGMVAQVLPNEFTWNTDKFTATLDLNTEEIVKAFNGAADYSMRSFTIFAYGTNVLYLNDKIDIMNHPYEDGMVSPSPAGTEFTTEAYVDAAVSTKEDIRTKAELLAFLNVQEGAQVNNTENEKNAIYFNGKTVEWLQLEEGTIWEYKNGIYKSRVIPDKDERVWNADKVGDIPVAQNFLQDIEDGDVLVYDDVTNAWILSKATMLIRNIGTGAEVYAGTNGSYHEFRSLTGKECTVSKNGDEIEIDVSNKVEKEAGKSLMSDAEHAKLAVALIESDAKSPVTDTNKLITEDDIVPSPDTLVDSDALTPVAADNKLLTQADSKNVHDNGFDLRNPQTIGTRSFDDPTRTFTLSISSGESSIDYWANWKKVSITTTKTSVIPDTTGNYYFYLDENGDMNYVNENAFFEDLIFKHALCGGVYWNSTKQEGHLWHEDHGFKAAEDHIYEHRTFGARYDSGYKMNGVVKNSLTFTSIDAGSFWDEDILHVTPSATANSFMYKLTTGGVDEWVFSSATNDLGLKMPGDTYFSYNKLDAGVYSLAEGERDSDYYIMFRLTMPLYPNGDTVKLVSQGAYASRGAARDAVFTEKSRIKLEGLPSPEMVFLDCYLINRYGKVQEWDDGSIFFDLESGAGGGSGGSSTAASSSETVAQTAHGFAVNDPLRLDGSTFVKAQADMADHSGVVGIVTSVPDANSFVITYSGIIATTFSKGDNIWLDVDTEAITNVQPSYVDGNTIVYIGTVVDTGLWLNIDVGFQVGGIDEPVDPAQYPPIAVIDGETTTPLSGTVFDGYIDEKPAHISAVTIGAFTSNNTCGVGSVSANSEINSDHPPYKALNKTCSGDLDNWFSDNLTFPNNLTVVLDSPVSINSFILQATDRDGDLFFPKDFSFKYSSTSSIPDTTAKSWINQNATRAEYKTYTLDSEIMVKSYELYITDGNGDYSALSQFNIVISSSSVLAGTKYTTTKDAVSTLHEITADTVIPIGADGNFTVWADNDGVVSLGDDINLVKGKTKDLLPAFSDYTLTGVGTVSVSGENDTTLVGWKALNHIIAELEGWNSGAVGGVGWIKVVLEEPKYICGFKLNTRNTATRYPKDFTFKFSSNSDTPATIAESYTGETVATAYGGKEYIFDTPILVKSYMLDVTATSDGSMIALTIFDIINYSPYYDIATGNLYEDGAVVEKCPLGQVTVSGGAITSVNPFYHGTKASVAINSGSDLAINTKYNENLPFFALNKPCQSEMYYNSEWLNVGSHSSSGGTSSVIHGNNFYVQTNSSYLTAGASYSGGEATSQIATASKVKTTIERGY